MSPSQVARPAQARAGFRAGSCAEHSASCRLDDVRRLKGIYTCRRKKGTINVSHSMSDATLDQVHASPELLSLSSGAAAAADARAVSSTVLQIRYVTPARAVHGPPSGILTTWTGIGKTV